MEKQDGKMHINPIHNIMQEKEEIHLHAVKGIEKYQWIPHIVVTYPIRKKHKKLTPNRLVSMNITDKLQYQENWTLS